MMKVGDNYGKEPCKLCLASDTQRHIIESCQPIIDDNQELKNSQGFLYEDIYTESIPKLKKIAELFRTAINTREELLSEQGNQ